MNDKTKNAPEIRFSGFTEDWEQRKLSEVLERYEDPIEIPKDGYHRLGIRSHGKGTFHSYVEKGKELESGKMHIVAANKFIVNITFGWEHAVAITDENDAGKLVSHRFPQFSIADNIEPSFLKYLILDKRFKNHLDLSSPGGAGRNRVLKIDQMLDYEVRIPSIAEQRRIGTFLTTVDDAITLHQRKCDELKIYKKGMLQKMFPQSGETKPQVRFPGFTEDWEQRKLSEIADKVTEKNRDMTLSETLTNSAEYGIISQIDFFDKEISNSEKIDGYYVVNDNDFVYNPRISNLAPVGPINRNKLGRSGVMSPLYTIFRTHDISPEYLEWFFKNTSWHLFMKFNGDSGARSDRFSIGNELFFTMPISIPTMEEQLKIGRFFNCLETAITLHQRKCDELKEYKWGLLQKMFV